jgi:CubicO group peptidase (beta-lactamase class C family)
MFKSMLKFRIFTLMALLIVLLGTGAPSQVWAFTASVPASEPHLRTSEPVGDIVADLDVFIPTYMSQEGIPGVTIALIRDGEVVWREGFGVANMLTRRPITPETLFEVASNSKVVTAYIALQLVDQGLLSLDAPLNDYLPEPWLPPSEYRDVISLRQVLSHSSGLGHLTLDRNNLFAPGEDYFYSGLGFGYLQAVIEQVTGQSLEQLAQEMVFTPLGMSSSSFVNRPEFIPRTANGHLHAIVPAILFTALYLVSLVIVGFIGLVILRIRTGQWRPSSRQVICALITAYPLSLLPAFILLGEINFSEFAWLTAIYGLFMIVFFTLLYLAGRFIIVRITSQRPLARRILAIVWVVLILVTLVLITNYQTNLPAPRWPRTEADAGGSMRATAGDMGTFLIELADPQLLSNDTAVEMRSSQIKLSSDLSWGLGPGIQHSQQGDALWQWGQHIDFQSIMIIYPEQNFGVVVCTNTDLLNPDVAVEIAHRALGGKIEPIRQAIHLEFNYREVE